MNLAIRSTKKLGLYLGIAAQRGREPNWERRVLDWLAKVTGPGAAKPPAAP